MSDPSTKDAKLFVILYFGAAIIGLVIIVEIYQSWNEDQSRALKLVIVEGILLQIVGFIILLKKGSITKIFSKRESNLRYDGVFCIVAGLFLQGISVYLS